MESSDASERSYSLRPRTARESPDTEVDAEPGPEAWTPPRRGRRRKQQKSAPLSKYRRKTANARERFRMREINEAFEALRRAVPKIEGACEAPGEKLTKISTLRLAMRYIAALTDALGDGPEAPEDWRSSDAWNSADRNSADSELHSPYVSSSDSRDPREALWRSSADRNSADSELRSPYFSPSPSSEGSSCGLSALLPSPVDFRCSLAFAPGPEFSPSLGSCLGPVLSPGPDSLLDQLDALPSPDVDLDDFFVT